MPGWALRTIRPPAAEVISLSQAKGHLHIDLSFTDEDTTLEGYIESAREVIEQHYNLRLAQQQVELLLQNFPYGDAIQLPIWPVQSADYLNFTDVANVTRTLTIGTDVLTRLYCKPAELKLPFGGVWPAQVLTTADPVKIGLTVGFITGASPETLKMPARAVAAMLLLIGHSYDNRSAVTLGTLMKSEKLLHGVDDLMADLRLY